MKKSTVKDVKDKEFIKKKSILIEELYASEVRYRCIFESAKDGILILDAETGKIVDVNPFLIDLLGYSKKEFLEKSIWEIGSFKDICENKEKFFELQKKEYVHYDDLPLVTSDGRKIQVEFISNVYLCNKIKVIQCNIRDNTEHNNILKFQADLINNVGQAVIATDLLGIVTYWNHAAEKIYGWSVSEAIGQNIINLTPALQSNEQAIEIMKKLSAGKTWAGEFHVKRKDGSSFPAFVTDTPILDSSGKLIGIIGISSDITERKEAEDKLKISEERFKIIFDYAPDAYYLSDLKGTFIDGNIAAFKMLGYNKIELIGKSLFKAKLISQNQFLKAAALLAKNSLGKATGPNEFMINHKNGSKITVEIRTYPVKIQDQGIVLGIARDITERKEYQQKIKDSENRFKAIFNQAPFAIALIDTQGRILISNLGLSKMIGYSLDELHKMKFTDFTYPEDIDKDMKNFTDLTKGKIDSYTMEKRYIHKNGAILWVNINVSLLSDVNGILIEILGMAEDITARKNSENKLIESEDKFRTITENSADAIFITDKEGRYLYVNKQAVKLLGYSKEELLTFTIADISPKNRIEEYFQIFQKVLITSSSYSEIELVKKDGSYAETDLNTILLPNGWIYGSCRDISERKQLEHELINAKEKAEESDHLKTAFLHNISHEIRTPMNAIVGFSEILNDPDLTPEIRKQYTNTIIQSSDQLLAIIDDIIRIATIEAGQEKIHKSKTNINLICKLLNEQFSQKANNKNIKLNLKTVLVDDKAIIITDATKLTQILTNLIVNALKFTPKGYVNFGYRIKDDQLEFYVEDSGIGVPLDMQEKIFNRFRQVETTSTRNFGGSGLGLSISKAYIEMLGGKMWLTSVLGKGSVFYFTIPYKKTKSKKLSATPSVKRLNFEFNTTKNLLIAEDGDVNFVLMEKMLSDSGINIIRAVNGIEAVKICESNPHIDLVLMDIIMPKMDGYEATTLIKKFRPDLYIIAQTAYSTEAEKNKALACGCSDVISKPIKRELLLSKIHEQLYKDKA